MATAIEYGLIAAGISVAIIAVVDGIPRSNSRWDDNLETKTAAKACVDRPANATDSAVVIKNWLGWDVQYRCSSWPRIFNPTYERRVW